MGHIKQEPHEPATVKSITHKGEIKEEDYESEEDKGIRDTMGQFSLFHKRWLTTPMAVRYRPIPKNMLNEAEKNVDRLQGDIGLEVRNHEFLHSAPSILTDIEYFPFDVLATSTVVSKVDTRRHPVGKIQVQVGPLKWKTAFRNEFVPRPGGSEHIHLELGEDLL